MFELTCSQAFICSITQSQPVQDITLLHLEAKAETAQPLELRLEWHSENIGTHVCWSPMGFRNKTVRPNWGGCAESYAMSGAPVFSNVGYDDMNRLTIACSDAKNRVRIRSGVSEETAMLFNVVIINVECNVDGYQADIRIDSRDMPFSRCVEDVVRWWETYDGYAPIAVPEDARQPLYSAWYSFHQQVDVAEIIAECEYFAKLGCKVLIVDDGWQTDNNERGYAYCGDWQPTPAKVPDMKAFVGAVHATGMKFMLWYSVPFVGVHSEAYKRFEGKLLYECMKDAWVVDPRYPEVREYLIGVYRRAAEDWGLDGFKLDFIDSFKQSHEVKPGMDYVSVYDAVDRLMKDVMRALTALNPDMLIEFRQSYMGPLMRTFGNMLRSGDCPADSLTNRLNTLSLRLTSGSTAVHSDMVMWSYSETAEQAAYQLSNVLFSVPQVSVRHDRMPESHARMVRHYLGFWKKYRSVLLDGTMDYQNYAADYTFVSASKDGVTAGAVYGGRIAKLTRQAEEIVLVNASPDNEIILDTNVLTGRYAYEAVDCQGDFAGKGEVVFDGRLVRVPMKVNGILRLAAIR